MNRVTLTIHLDLPDGVIPDVQYGTDTAPQFEPPLPEAPQDLFQAVAQVFDQPASAPVCAQHGNSMKRWPAGVSKTKKGPNGGPATFNASWRCNVADCTTKPIWDRDAA